jgi:hypothetical protein
MKRIVGSIVSMSALAALLGACDGEGDYGDGGGRAWGGPSASGGCEQYATCDTCTPVTGCGWCYDSNGMGVCHASPEECETPAFSWTWDSSGCRGAADASVAPADASVPLPRPTEGGASDGGSPEGGMTGGPVDTGAPPPADASPLPDSAASTDAASE